MEVLLRYKKLLNVLYTVPFFLASGRGIDNVLVRLSLIEQMIRDANLVCISFSVKNQQTLWEPE